MIIVVLHYISNIMATIDIPDKICSHCGGIRWKTEYRKSTKNPENKILIYRCSVKAGESYSKWRLQNLEKAKKYNIELCRIRRANGHYKTSKEKERNKQKAKKESDTLCDNYIYRIIFSSVDRKSLNRSNVPQELIDIKRKQLLLTRQLKQLTK